MPADKTPADLTITPRDTRFGRGLKQDRWWHDGDPVATAFFNALSVTFPRGEAFFVESVRGFRDGTPPKLEAEIGAFIKQEVNHSREHVAFNKRVVDAGYDISRLEARVSRVLELVKSRPAIANLCVTMALEHFTAILARDMLSRPDAFAGADDEIRQMWRWHAIEEIEHKGVAYDTWLHATRDWPRWRRWRVKSLVMIMVTSRFVKYRVEGILDLLRQDGLTGPRIWARLFWFAFGRPGMLRRVVPAWASYFLPGFHPWNHDDRALIAFTDSAYPDALAAKAA
jgi:hypothetical protein